MRTLGRRLDPVRPHVPALFRIVVGLLFATHGAASLFGVVGGAPSGAVPVGVWPYWFGR